MVSESNSSRGRRRAPEQELTPSVGPWTRRAAALVSTAILIASALGGGAVFALNSLGKNIHTISSGELGEAQYQYAGDTSATNFLIMGSDTREGQGTGFGDVAGARSDTTLLVHLYEGRKSALVVSIPRDSYVKISACKDADGKQMGSWETKFNAAFAVGGPVCTIKTIQDLTGITINQFAVIDFNAFKTVVDAIGGVEVCFTTPVYDPYVPGRGGSGLNLPAGYSTITGKQALAYVRARETIGDGSDLGRIERQQAFLKSMARGMQSQGVLTNPKKVYRILDAVTASITTSTNLSTIQNLSDFALSMGDLQPSNIKFITVPYELIGDGNVHWNAETELVWEAIRNSQPYPPVDPSTSASPSASATASASASATPSATAAVATGLITPPADIKVIVKNGTGTTGLGKKAATQLREAGFNVTSVTNAPTKVTATQIEYGTSFIESAKTLAYSAQTTSMTVNADLTKNLIITIGPDWNGAQEVVMPDPNASVSATPSSSASPSATATNADICTEGNNRVKTK